MARRLAASLRFPLDLGVDLVMHSPNIMQRDAVNIVKCWEGRRGYEMIIQGRRRSGRTTAALLALIAICQREGTKNVYYIGRDLMEYENAIKQFWSIVREDGVVVRGHSNGLKVHGVPFIFMKPNDILPGMDLTNCGVAVDSWEYHKEYDHQRILMRGPTYIIKVRDIDDRENVS